MSARCVIIPVQTFLFTLLFAIAAHVGAQVGPVPNAAGPWSPPTFVMPGTPQWRAAMPAMPHEKNPESRPYPDYFSLALALTPLEPGSQAKALFLNRRPVVSEFEYIVLPVQSQAFSFSPTFRALIGAHVDRLLSAGGVSATPQTAINHSHGPFVRRFSEEALLEFGKEHSSHKLIGLYLGHDGVGSAFVTLVVNASDRRLTAHRTVSVPDTFLEAFAAVKGVLPDMFRELGMPTGSVAMKNGSDRFECSMQVWQLNELARTSSPGLQACHALVVASLLPPFGGSSRQGVQWMTPAKIAWLARAYVLSEDALLWSLTGKGIRDLAASQLGLMLANQPLSDTALPDPVLSTISDMLTAQERLAKRPVRSGTDALELEIKRLTQELPPFAAMVVAQRVRIDEPFSPVDYCAMEATVPTMATAMCSRSLSKAVITRLPREAELAVLRDWRIMAAFKEFSYQALTRGSTEDARHVLLQTPQDIVEHPYFRRLTYRVASGEKVMGSFEQHLSRSREQVKSFVQSTVDLQADDDWFAGYSLSEHMWTNNFNVMNDTQIVPVVSAETRLLSVMKFDRFARTGQEQSGLRRQVGDPAYFLASSPGDVRFGMQSHLVRATTSILPASVSAAPMAQEYKPSLFPRHPDFQTHASSEKWRAIVSNTPQSLRARTSLAVSLLKDGVNVSDAVGVIDERLPSLRIDDRIQESHAWALPAHAMYFSGQIAAAKKYYARVAEIGSGSESDMQARVRLSLIAGDYKAALNEARGRMARYGSEFSVLDTTSLLFLNKQPQRAWSLFLDHASTAEYLPYWSAALVGHRQQGLDLGGVRQWLSDANLDQLQIDRVDVKSLYGHMYAVMDRLPSDRDVELLRQLSTRQGYTDEIWSVSAKLIQTALNDRDFGVAYDLARKKLSPFSNERNTFMLPLYAWVAWQATKGTDENLDQVRDATVYWGFDELLAKAMVLSLEGKVDESLRYFNAARYELSSFATTNNELIQRPVSAAYQYALGGYLMNKKSGVDQYRIETLSFVRAYQKVFPQFAWVHSMEALLERDAKSKKAAACRAFNLDPKSHFLQEAGFGTMNAANCPKIPG